MAEMNPRRWVDTKRTNIERTRSTPKRGSTVEQESGTAELFGAIRH